MQDFRLLDQTSLQSWIFFSSSSLHNASSAFRSHCFLFFSVFKHFNGLSVFYLWNHNKIYWSVSLCDHFTLWWSYVRCDIATFPTTHPSWRNPLKLKKYPRIKGKNCFYVVVPFVKVTHIDKVRIEVEIYCVSYLRIEFNRLIVLSI